jgi:hypothetical protein
VATDLIDILLLLALPASGKSEIRRYLEHVDPAAARHDLHIGPTLQLDDYPYVHLMRRVSQELRARGRDPVFFASDGEPLADPRDWHTLTLLLDEDYADLTRPLAHPAQAGPWILGRLDRVRRTAGAGGFLADIPASVRRELEAAIEDEAAVLLGEKLRMAVPDLAGHTVIVEFARGGPEGAWMPLSDPHGYRSSLALFSPAFLARAAVLYVRVTPEESRRRNRERTRPGAEGDASILHHGVPEEVLRHDYGVDDLMWLRDQGGGSHLPVTIPPGDHFEVPVAIFDNRADHTSFLRADPEQWDQAAVARLHAELARLLAPLATRA